VILWGAGLFLAGFATGVSWANWIWRSSMREDMKMQRLVALAARRSQGNGHMNYDTVIIEGKATDLPPDDQQS
jgi:hypothetical protein